MMHWDTFKHVNYSTVGGDGGCKVSEIRGGTTSPMPGHKGFKLHSKMPTVRNARLLVTSRELKSGLQISGKAQLNALFSVVTMNADTDSASEKNVKVIQGRVAHGTLCVRLTCPTMDNRHNKLSQVPEF